MTAAIKIKQPEPKPCACGMCGKLVYPRYNSTIFPSKYAPGCPNKPQQQKEIKRYAFQNVPKSANVPTRKKRFNLYATRAWKYLSRYVLVFYANNDLMVHCSTNPNYVYHVTDKRIQCGHYIKVNDANSTNYSVALDFINMGPQSLQENVFNGGNQLVMREWLVSQHGEKAIQELELKAKGTRKLDLYTLEQEAEKWKANYKALLTERGFDKCPWSKSKKK